MKMKFVRHNSKIAKDFYPTSTVKIFRKGKCLPRKAIQDEVLHIPNKNAKQKNNTDESDQSKSSDDPEYFENFVRIQMLPTNLHQQIFPQNSRTLKETDHENARGCRAYLQHHGIDITKTEAIKNIGIKLPKLHGKNIEEHFYAIATQQIEPYIVPLKKLLASKQLPKRPKCWNFKPGWTIYDTETHTSHLIDYPKEHALIFDVEVCVSEGQLPTIATAMGAKHWYSWASPKLFAATPPLIGPKIKQTQVKYTANMLIPLGNCGTKLVIGHNVSYDRARVREQYLIEDTDVRFLDTMSLHVCVSGITSYQRAMLKSKKELAPEDVDWQAQSSLNGLAEVYKLYCDGKTLSKEPRNIFVHGSLADVRDNFQLLMTYCAGDVSATSDVLLKLYPLYEERFPHPVTLAGILEMGSAYLPVNSNWRRYINEADLTYEDLNIEAKYHLARRADEACTLLNDAAYRNHLWLWDEDWSKQDLKMKKTNLRARAKLSKDSVGPVVDPTLPTEEQRLWKKFHHLYEMKNDLPVRRPLLPGYPLWYRKLCVKPPKYYALDNEWKPGPTEISTGMQIAPKLLSLCWEGYPLHYIREHGWGFLVPFRTNLSDTRAPQIVDPIIPIEALVKRCPVPEFARSSPLESEFELGTLTGELELHLTKRQFIKKSNKDYTDGRYKGSGVWCNQVLHNCCFFLKLPHKNGNTFRVGNPLSKDFLNKFSENVLSSGDAESGTASRVIEIARMMSYWRNNRDRITGQMVVLLALEDLPEHIRKLESMLEYGAILPQVVACGTLTRRAMEPTWMTASNARVDRIGSELRAMVQAPPGYKIVGADVDSQELWIASVLGDAYACGEHGGTPLGWMTLSGSKANGTDMHSVTAKAVGISRDHAKVINYARIYGAGQNFAEGLLKQFNPTFYNTEAKSKAMKMFGITKGKRIYRLRDEFSEDYSKRDFTGYEAQKLALMTNRPMQELFHPPTWYGGTESSMFNRLEEIAKSEYPVTPFLNCRLSRALETNVSDEQRFLPTRVNWVVQSGAVDFLHIMLVSMRWLMGSNIRFCLSFHDELRYLVHDQMAYKAALAMHITNLLTRSFCSSRIGLYDLPLSVAFFSSVEVDTVLRKEATMDCKTPSNPHGLHIGYAIAPGESLNIYDAIEKAGGNDLTTWKWIK